MKHKLLSVIVAVTIWLGAGSVAYFIFLKQLKKTYSKLYNNIQIQKKKSTAFNISSKLAI